MSTGSVLPIALVTTSACFACCDVATLCRMMMQFVGISVAERSPVRLTIEGRDVTQKFRYVNPLKESERLCFVSYVDLTSPFSVQPDTKVEICFDSNIIPSYITA